MDIIEKTDLMVRKHVHQNANTLVQELAHHEEYQPMLEPIMGRDDFATPAYERGYRVAELDDGIWLVHPLENGERFKDGTFGTIAEAWEEACSLEGIEPYFDEVYEHYIVSDMLAYQLMKREQIVTTNLLGLTVWGRCETGTCIYMDDVMQEIAETTNI